MDLSDKQIQRLAGLDDSSFIELDGVLLDPRAAAAFENLQTDAANFGFDLKIASAFRSYSRQLEIWNGKVSGSRPVLDDQNVVVDLTTLSKRDCLDRILRFSALPGTSRHHWGTDIDVFDAAAMPEGYRLRLTPDETTGAGVFAPLHRWLDGMISAGDSHGFYRPYDRDRGGVAPERWHLSYAPKASEYQGLVSPAFVQTLWDYSSGAELPLLRETLEPHLATLIERFVDRVAPLP
ncbi:MAG: M15 family metallopeptidase [Pseudomonadota bacterium]